MPPLASTRRVAVGHTCSPAPLSTRIRAFRPLDALTANIQIESSLSSWRFASLVLGLLPALGFLVSPLATAPTLASKRRIVCPRVSFRFTVVFLALTTLSLRAFHLPKNPSALTCQGSCAAQSHHRFSVPASTLARKHARLGKTHDLPREPLSGDHGRLLARAPSQSLLGPPAGGPHMLQICNCATSFTQEASMSPRSRPSLYIFSYLLRGSRIPFTSAAVRFPPLPSCSTLSTRHASNPKRRKNKETRDRALPSHFVMSKA